MEEKKGAKKAEVKKVEKPKKEEKKVAAKNEEIKKENVKKETPKKANTKKEKTGKKNNGIALKVVVGLVIIILVLVIAWLAYGVISNTPTRTVNDLLNSLKTFDFEKVDTYVQNTEDEAFDINSLGGQTLDNENEKLLFEKLEWKINKENIDGENATVEVEVTNKDFQVILANYMQKVLKAAFSGEQIGDEQYQTYLVDELKNENVSVTTVNKTINLVKVDEKWKVVPDDQLLDALLPGMQEIVNSLS